MKKESWVVVANSALARLFKVNKKELVELQALIHVESRMKEQELVADKPGETFESFGPGSRYPMAEPQSQKKTEAVLFARQVASHLESARVKGEIDRLYVAASPAFLGILRQEMTPLSKELIASEVSKDITAFKPAEIKEYFPIAL